MEHDIGKYRSKWIIKFPSGNSLPIKNNTLTSFLKTLFSPFKTWVKVLCCNHLLPAPIATPTLFLPFPFSWHHCYHTKSASPDHTVPSLAMSLDATRAILQNEILASIFRLFPEATQKTHPIMKKKPKRSYYAVSLFHCFVIQNNFLNNKRDRDRNVWLRVEGKTTHRCRITVSHWESG